MNKKQRLAKKKRARHARWIRKCLAWEAGWHWRWGHPMGSESIELLGWAIVLGTNVPRSLRHHFRADPFTPDGSIRRFGKVRCVKLFSPTMQHLRVSDRVANLGHEDANNFTH